MFTTYHVIKYNIIKRAADLEFYLPVENVWVLICKKKMKLLLNCAWNRRLAWYPNSKQLHTCAHVLTPLLQHFISVICQWNKIQTLHEAFKGCMTSLYLLLCIYLLLLSPAFCIATKISTLWKLDFVQMCYLIFLPLAWKKSVCLSWHY